MTVTLRDDGWSVPHVVAVLLFGVILIVGFRKSPLSIPAEPGEGDEDRPGIEHLGIIYLSAWRTLWREKWLLRFFGLVFGIQVIGRLIAYGLERYYLDHYVVDMFTHQSWIVSIRSLSVDYLTYHLPNRFGFHSLEAFASFLPNAGLRLTQVHHFVMPFALLIFMLWAWKRLKAFGDEESENTRPVIDLMKPVAVLALITLIATPFYILPIYFSQMPMPTLVRLASTYGWSFAYAVFVTPLLLGGLIASLQRIRSNESVSSNSFLSDAARYFKPLSVLFLLLWMVSRTGLVSLVWELAQALRLTWFWVAFDFLWLAGSLVALLLMFAPYAVVTQRLGALESIRSGVRVWRSYKKDVISFVAIGITLIMTGRIAAEMIGIVASQFSPLMPIAIIAASVMGILITAFMLVAVWEFYRRIVDVGSEVEVLQEGVEV